MEVVTLNDIANEDDIMHTIKGKLVTFGLTDNHTEGRHYIIVNTNFHTLRKYFKTEVYDALTGTGEQRESEKRHVSKLENAFSNGQYTPALFTAAIAADTQITIDNNNVTIELDEENPLPLIDGGQRLDALENIRQGTNTPRSVDNLAIPLMVLLDPDQRKADFINLQSGRAVSRSHLLSMQIDQSLMDDKKLQTFNLAKELVKRLHLDDDSPWRGQVNFGAIAGGNLVFNTLASPRKGGLITSLYGSAQLLKSMDFTVDRWISEFKCLYKFIGSQTNCMTKGKLLNNPDGPKGCASLFIGVVNVWSYYLYLRGILEAKPKDKELLLDSLRVFDQDVSGDLSTRRQALLMGAFAQAVFNYISQEEDSPIGTHFDIPIGLMTVTSESSFAVQKMPVPLAEKKKRGRKAAAPATSNSNDTLPSVIPPSAEPFSFAVDTSLLASDTVEGFDA